MWCLLLLVWRYSERFSTRNETGLPSPGGAQPDLAGVCIVSGAGGCAYGCSSGRGLPHYLLPRAFGVDGLSAVLHQLHCFGAISGGGKGIDSQRGEMGGDWGWSGGGGGGGFGGGAGGGGGRGGLRRGGGGCRG